MAEEYKSVHTGPDIDAAVTRALPGGGIDQAINAKPNPNLLDNVYFGNPVNQRGQTEYTGAGYTIDRWTINDGFVTVSNSCITISGQTYFYQIIEDNGSFRNRIFTGTILFSDGTLKTGSVRLGTGLDTGYTFFSDGTDQFYMYDLQDPNLIQCAYRTELPERSLVAAKMELGTEQTLAHQENGVWVLNEIPNYGEELAKCQNCYRTFNAWTKFAADYIDANRIMFSIPGKMRANPVVGGNFKLYVGLTEQSGFAFTAYDNGNNTVIVATKNNHGLTSAWLGVSADFGTLDANL